MAMGHQAPEILITRTITIASAGGASDEAISRLLITVSLGLHHYNFAFFVVATLNSDQWNSFRKAWRFCPVRWS